MYVCKYMYIHVDPKSEFPTTSEFPAQLPTHTSPSRWTTCSLQPQPWTPDPQNLVKIEPNMGPALSDKLILHKVFLKLFCPGQLPHQSVCLSFTITNIKNKSTDLCKNWHLQNECDNTLCDIKTGDTASVQVDPKPLTLHPKLQTLNPTPYTLHPKPQALYPEPWTLKTEP
jgi:hypothetical protein